MTKIKNSNQKNLIKKAAKQWSQVCGQLILNKIKTKNEKKIKNN